MISPRIALIEPVGSHGGMDYYDSGLIGEINKLGIYAKWYTCDISKIRGELSFPIARTFTGIWGSDPGWKRGFRYLRGLIASLVDAKKNHLNIVHYHLFHVGILEFLGVLLARIFILKVVLTVHDVEAFRPGAHSKLLRYLSYKFSSKLIVHNDVSKNELLKTNPEVQSKIAVIPHGSYVGLVPNRIEKSEARLKLNLPLNEKLILFFGQIKDVKGLDILIEAFAKSYLKISPVKLVIAGKVWKSDFTQYQKLIDDLGIQDYCHLDIRYIPDDEISAFYSAADLVVLPYRKIYQSGVLLMAMTYQVMVLASDLQGMSEIITHGKNGYLFKTENPNDLADNLISILSPEDSNKYQQVIDNAAKDMTTRFSWSTVSKLTIDTYNEVLRVG